MKKYSNAIFVIFLIIFAAGLWLFNSNITRVPLLSDDKRSARMHSDSVG